MSEERTPIDMKAEGFLKGLNANSKVFELNIEYEYTEEQLILFAEIYHKAHRFKFKHTKEDVIEGYIEGKNNAGVHSVNEIETWYNENHNK